MAACVDGAVDGWLGAWMVCVDGCSFQWAVARLWVGGCVDRGSLIEPRWCACASCE